MQAKKLFTIGILILFASGVLSRAAAAHTSIKNICRLKGQEENTLQGVGIVVGLKGSGDGGNFLPTLRSVEKIMKVMGDPTTMKEIKDAKNVALVTVTATIPAAGARQGDKIDCVVSSLGSCKSLAGGRLFLTAMIGPDPKNPRVYAMSEGPITLDDSATPTTGRVFQGCRLEEEFMNLFFQDNKITLVLDKYHADFQVARDVANTINNHLSSSGRIAGDANAETVDKSDAKANFAKALNPVNVEVAIPPAYADDPVDFAALVLGLPLLEPKSVPRVVINERSGSIVISGDVEIGAVAVTHKNIVIETAEAPYAKRFVGLDPSDPTPQNPTNPKLKALVEALNALHVAAPDIIDIIKGLDKNGKLYAQLVIE
ncbi:MAG: flagellar basal body P-ring protein FlgI [Pirellulales bacterium]|nr:flagellar basal body P-ring protein FlgI [Pirellulales bacterium]